MFSIHKLTERYHCAGQTLHLRHLSPIVASCLSNVGALIDVNVKENPQDVVVEEVWAG
ncbi:hypothetical protein [Hymenobacter armeniacus]|uniref:Uncharacterized protein n=1 Tax=Hymenobacter armeniacus TaxID=2771358 RepID=A0ABR8JZ69_9BACT|nr:hypothetical protein [Hymenobacter armeniacus]MBD2724188.1 hypothetical protein [Hymenobacter armeniacus]